MLADKGAGEAEADAGLSLSEPLGVAGKDRRAIWAILGLLDSGSAAPRQVDLERFGPALDGVRRDRVLGKFFVERSGSLGCVVGGQQLDGPRLIPDRPPPSMGSGRGPVGFSGNQGPTCARECSDAIPLAR